MGNASPRQRDDNALTKGEKTTLRLLLAGHDAKLIARELGLSVHTVNERLRDARRKLGVASSREAARRLAESDAADPQSLGTCRWGFRRPAHPWPLPICQTSGRDDRTGSPGSVEECSSCRCSSPPLPLPRCTPRCPRLPLQPPPKARPRASAAEAWVARVDLGK
ncbi:helix-turn-helix transcriptional regulator [Sphingomonas sp.]|uniref:response regulator transcription factor n=1 Tax=Sphingomonas sp. TaxID=28214 RepID=UPI0028A7D708|nr:helix-turn-helix transcriptional regulator [Sphingomonas sp.]